MTVEYMGYIRTRQIFCNWKGRGETDVRHEDPSRGINLNLVVEYPTPLHSTVHWSQVVLETDHLMSSTICFVLKSHHLGMIF